ncbi:hypothetical protein EMIHUDRAFT_63451 [Emiliania huxleyi CCMP1516]|uniref:RNA 3'-terminal phosphate cyclase n=2 Tax=Emiliania huxleyi TaxID=2903 RepID=A0A0D3KBX4_EMIH1|nr:hypothetical protein EMIHUDRAFT_63451 [Emiliania huxleyi CCMP1516]EOD33259.1 hypothetical protein EMIHUDRAFT_63451 [Emiliania huxleyi CCMP1516]|eukprot:XP_005785688.1 hypothetical protein EMIHUDRAFT_63451 [Emiliania huxleyi CCMP1516]
MLHFSGAEDLRQRVVLATLARRQIRITGIRAEAVAGAEEGAVGLSDAEASFLRLVEKVVDGCEIAINETGTELRYRPGILVGGAGLVHDCGKARGVGYFVEPLLALAPFAKRDLQITFRGLTNHAHDVGVDVLRSASLPLLKRFGIEGEMALQVVRRGAPPSGAGDGVGEVVLKLPAVRTLHPLHLTDPGRVKRVRGLAYGSRVSPQILARVVEAARGEIEPRSSRDRAAGAGYAVCLVAESTNGVLLAAEATGGGGADPEEVGAAAASQLMEEVVQGGAIDAAHQPLALLLMAFGAQDVSRLRTGPLSPAAVSLLRGLDTFLGVRCHMTTEPADGSVLVSCRGVGFSNAAKSVI